MQSPEIRKSYSQRCLQKKEGENIKIRFRRNHTDRLTVGIVGAQAGAGVTHLCIALAHFSAEHELRSTAVVELSNNHAMAQMNTTTDKRKFQIGRVTYFCDASLEDMPDILNEDYQVYILDMGSDFYRIRTEFLRCDRRFVVGDLNPWQRAGYEEFVSDIIEEEDYEEWSAFLSSHGGKRDKARFRKAFHIPVYSIPYIENPFEMSKKQSTFLRGLL